MAWCACIVRSQAETEPHKLAPGDLIRLELRSRDGQSESYPAVVRADGTVYHNRRGQRWQKVAGLDAAAAARAMETASTAATITLLAAREARVPSPGPIQAGDRIEFVQPGYFYIGVVARYVNANGSLDVPLVGNLKNVVGLDEEQLLGEIDKIDPFNAGSYCTPIRTAAADPQLMKRRARPLQTGDLLAVTMYWDSGDVPETPLLRRIDRDGTARLPVVGSIKLAGLDCADAARAIEKVDVCGLSRANQLVLIELIETADKATVPPGPIQDGDTLLIRMWDIDAPNKETAIHVPVARGELVKLPLDVNAKLEGLSEHAAEEAIKKMYRDAGLLQNMTVYVLRETHKSR